MDSTPCLTRWNRPSKSVTLQKELTMNVTFAQRIEAAAQSAYDAAAPFMASPAEVHDAIRPVVTELQKMPRAQAVAYIRESFSHVGHQALAVRMFKNQPV
jgi:hypothetical protein